MEVLREDDALGYCTGTRAQRDAHLARGQASEASPAYLLPIFELCRAIHFGARERKRFEVGGFRDCWHELVDIHEARSYASGCVLRLLDAGDDGRDNLPHLVWSRAKVERGDLAEEDAAEADPRDRVRDPQPFQECFRVLGDVAFESVAAEEEWERQWEHPLLALPGRDLDGHGRETVDLVLDTNFFVDLLNELPEDGRLVALPCQHGDGAIKLGGAKRRFQEVLRTRGLAGKLIVPIAVLVETFGIVRVKDPQKYERAGRVMDIMAKAGGDWPLWQAFQFEGLSLDLLDVYLGLHEQMAQRVPDRHRWPDFTDAFVLAHGLLNECPVISGEWTQKADWDEAKKLFPYLYPR